MKDARGARRTRPETENAEVAFLVWKWAGAVFSLKLETTPFQTRKNRLLVHRIPMMRAEAYHEAQGHKRFRISEVGARAGTPDAPSATPFGATSVTSQPRAANARAAAAPAMPAPSTVTVRGGLAGGVIGDGSAGP